MRNIVSTHQENRRMNAVLCYDLDKIDTLLDPSSTEVLRPSSSIMMSERSVRPLIR